MIISTVEFFVCVFCNSTMIKLSIYTRRTNDQTVILQSCFLDILPILPMYSNILASCSRRSSPRFTMVRISDHTTKNIHHYLHGHHKRLNIFDECTVRYVYLLSQKEECTSSSWGDRKVYTSDTTTNSQGMSTEKN